MVLVAVSGGRRFRVFSLGDLNESDKLTVVNLSPHDPYQQVGRPVHPLYAEPAVQAWSWQKGALYQEHASSPGPWTRRAVSVEQPSWGPQQVGSKVTLATAQLPA